MIKIIQKKDCCGCSACADVCVQNSIAITTDAEGFTYPTVDVASCIECGLCERVCPIINIPRENNISSVFAVKNKNELTRLKSSSGGVFELIAKKILEMGGVIVGCRLNNEIVAEHVVASDIDELQHLLSSKYVQSDTIGIFKEVKKILKDGKEVLFSGTPCQVAALHNFLRKPYDNLTTVDILCHGVPSPKILKEYVDRLEKRYGAKMTSINFRCKEKSWKRLYINETFSNGKRHFLYSGYDSYMQLFLSDRLQRPSCFHCPYNSLHRPGDISLGDFWGIGKTHPDADDNKGISLVLINNLKGTEMWHRIKEDTSYFTSNIDTAVEGNKVLIKHLPSEKASREFYHDYVTLGFDAAIAKHAPEKTWLYQKYYNFMRWGLDIVRKIKNESY